MSPEPPSEETELTGATETSPSSPRARRRASSDGVALRPGNRVGRYEILEELGAIYPDVIESGGAKTKKAITIKSHHNVGGLPETLGLKLLEPLRELFKDEVRELGVALGLPADMVYRHPFPGPGLGVRVLGEVKPEYVSLLQRAGAHLASQTDIDEAFAAGKTAVEAAIAGETGKMVALQAGTIITVPLD